MFEDSKRTSDERYLRTEAKIQSTIDTMFEIRRVVTKVRDFCVSAGISPATFYGHYESIGEVIFERDAREAKSLAEYLTSNSQKIEIIFQKTFYYIDNHKAYFKGVTIRSNICPYKSLIIILKPALLENWREYHKWDENRGIKLEKVCKKLAFELASEYSEWIEYEDFDKTKIMPHVRRLIYLTNTACQRLDR